MARNRADEGPSANERREPNETNRRSPTGLRSGNHRGDTPRTPTAHSPWGYRAVSEAIDRDDAGTLMAAWDQIEPQTLGSTAARDLGMLG